MLLLLRWSVALVWIITGLLVLHPTYREIGRSYLARLGIGDWAMWATCAGEIALGLRLGLGRARGWTVLAQFFLIIVFTTVLATLKPGLLVNPFGMLSKNVPLLAAAAAAFIMEREGFGIRGGEAPELSGRPLTPALPPRARGILLGAVAFIWLYEGMMPKILFQQPVELAVVKSSGLAPLDASTFLVFLGIAQICSAVLLLILRGRLLSLLLGAQLAGLVILPVLVGAQAPVLVIHPFAPLVKNLPILAATFVLLWAGCRARSALRPAERNP